MTLGTCSALGRPLSSISSTAPRRRHAWGPPSGREPSLWRRPCAAAWRGAAAAAAAGTPQAAPTRSRTQALRFRVERSRGSSCLGRGEHGGAPHRTSRIPVGLQSNLLATASTVDRRVSGASSRTVISGADRSRNVWRAVCLPWIVSPRWVPRESTRRVAPSRDGQSLPALNVSGPQNAHNLSSVLLLKGRHATCVWLLA